MLKPSVIKSLPAFAGPVLSVYLDTDQAKKDNRGLKPGYLIRLESQAKTISQTLSLDDQEPFRKQLLETEAYLQNHPPRCRGNVNFAGGKRKEVSRLEMLVEDEVQ